MLFSFRSSLFFMLLILLYLGFYASGVPVVVALDSDPPDQFIELDGKELWISGSNVAWVDFARDLGPGGAQLTEFEAAFRELRANGGNTFRLWLHTTGAHTPSWSGNLVTGPGTNAIANLTAILDLAQSFDISLMLCLWSFDMLRATNSQTVLTRNHAILTQQDNRDSYFENALIPMVESLKGHRAILAWEIFNEAEGMSQEFGWNITTNHVPMLAIQAFVNQAASAIRGADPDAKVTTGVNRLNQVSDIYSDPLLINYYRDDRLIAAGGKEDGVLDFYTVHYYGSGDSPFNRSTSYFEFDKPMILAEFFISGDVEGVPVDQIYKRLYDNGFAGALSWQWVDWRQNRNQNIYTWPNTLRNTQHMFNHYRDKVELVFTEKPASFTFEATETVIEAGFPTELSWKIRDGNDITLNGEPVLPMDRLEVSPEETTDYVLRMTSHDNSVTEETITVTVIPRIEVNRVREEYILRDEDGLWTEYDMDGSYGIVRVDLTFDGTLPDSLILLSSLDGREWTYWHAFEPEVSGQTELHFDTPRDTRFVHISGSAPFTVSDAIINGLLSELQPPVIRITYPSDGQNIFPGAMLTVTAEVTRGSGSFSGVYFHVNGELKLWRRFRPYEFRTEFGDPGEYIIEAEVRESNFPNFFSRPVTVVVPEPSTKARYEAQDAVLSGGPEVLSHSGASGGQYVNMEGSGSITWNNIHVEEAGRYTARIGYYLPFDHKEQFLDVNGIRVDTLLFVAPLQQWRFIETELDLTEGTNSVALHHFWGWMWFDYLEVLGAGTGTSVDDRAGELTGLPRLHKLGASYPNPFNPVTIIPYELGSSARVVLTVYDLMGRRIARFDRGRQPAGDHHVRFDGSGLSSGIYLYRLQADGQVLTGRMMLLK